MKITQFLKAATLFAVCSATALHATTPAGPGTYAVVITGSTAFRGATMNAIANILTSPVASYVGSSLSGASYATFSGTIGTDTYNIYTSWSGSENGIAHVAQKTTPLPPIQVLTLANAQGTVNKATAPTAISGGTLASSPAYDTTNFPADIAMSDGWQASSPFHGTQLGTTYGALTGTTLAGFPGASIVGVVPFKFVASKTDSAGTSFLPATFSGSLTTSAGSTAATLDTANPSLPIGAVLSGNSDLTIDTTISAISGTSVTLSIPAHASGTSVATTFSYAGLGNMTDLLAKKAFESTNGSLATVGQFSGSEDDLGVTVVPVGRNHDSGTRSAFVLNIGIDKPGTAVTAIQQYYPTDANGAVIGNSGALTSITGKELVPAESINGLSYTVGQSGYSSGGSVAKVFTATNNLANTVFVSYLGINDAATALGGNAQEMSYDGVYYSPTAVKEGTYTFWSYEHLYYQSTLAAKQKFVATAIATQIATSDAAVSGIVYDSTFHVKRDPDTKDGAIVTQ